MALHVGGVLQQRQNSALAVLGKGMQVEGFLVERGEIDLEVAGVNDDADGRFDGQRHAVHQRMGDADRLNGERPKGELFPRCNLDQLGVIEQLVLFELAFDVGQRELGGVDRDLELAQDPRQAADVVFVAVGEDDAADAAACFQ